MFDKKYCYPDSHVLINKLAIRDDVQLNEAEREITAYRLAALVKTPIEGYFDFSHLKAIHRYIFQDLYEWAGEVRSVNIAKGNMFCAAQFIANYACEIFLKLKKDEFLKGRDFEGFVSGLAYYYSEINALHPFREGNGRSQREFMRALALASGYRLQFSKAKTQTVFDATVRSFSNDLILLTDVFRTCCTQM
jgi:cell filamentation protein